MGDTVESFKTALEGEISRWSGFARALRKPDLEAFEKLIGISRSYASEIGCAAKIIFEPMVISILLFQQKRIRVLEKELQEIQLKTVNSLAGQEPSASGKPGLENSIQKIAGRGGQTRLF